jgi:hypothetical protein
VDLDARAAIDADPDAAFAALADLTTYPRWLTIVATAMPVRDETWDIELAARIGPFTRTKRLRMVRTGHDATRRTVRFERREDDGPTDNEWILTAEATTTTATATRTAVRVQLHYGGTLFPGADLVLKRDVDRAGERLERYLRSRTSEG